MSRTGGIPMYEYVERQWGRLPSRDSRSTRHLLGAKLPSYPQALPTHKQWWLPAAMDQGNTSQCVEFAAECYLRAGPTRSALVLPRGSLYAAAQAVDGSPLPHDGTSVHAMAHVLQHDGHFGEYVWIEPTTDDQDVTQLVTWLKTRGPLILGTDWYEGMMGIPTGDRSKVLLPKDGFARIGGGVVGGHSYVLGGWDDDRDAARGQNSWGRAWGDLGRFWISRTDLKKLLADGGECLAAVELRVA